MLKMFERESCDCDDVGVDDSFELVEREPKDDDDEDCEDDCVIVVAVDPFELVELIGDAAGASAVGDTDEDGVDGVTIGS